MIDPKELPALAANIMATCLEKMSPSEAASFLIMVAGMAAEWHTYETQEEQSHVLISAFHKSLEAYKNTNSPARFAKGKKVHKPSKELM